MKLGWVPAVLVVSLSGCSAGGSVPLSSQATAALQPTPIIVYVTPAPTLVPTASTPASTASPITAPPRTAPPSVRLTPVTTPASKPTPLATPAPSGSASKGKIHLLVRKSTGFIEGDVIQEIVNDGTAWISVSTYNSSYTIYDAAGGITATSSFDVALPALLPPGGTGYLVAELLTDSGSTKDYDHAEADGYFDPVEAPATTLTVTNTKVKSASYGDGVEVVGQVNNPGADKVASVSVGAVFFDAKGNVIGAVSTYAENVEPGGKRSFSATSYMPAAAGEIAHSTWFANDNDF